MLQQHGCHAHTQQNKITWSEVWAGGWAALRCDQQELSPSDEQRFALQLPHHPHSALCAPPLLSTGGHSNIPSTACSASSSLLSSSLRSRKQSSWAANLFPTLTGFQICGHFPAGFWHSPGASGPTHALPSPAHPTTDCCRGASQESNTADTVALAAGSISWHPLEPLLPFPEGMSLALLGALAQSALPLLSLFLSSQRVGWIESWLLNQPGHQL